jgi:hypothetical protein
MARWAELRLLIKTGPFRRIDFAHVSTPDSQLACPHEIPGLGSHAVAKGVFGKEGQIS